MRWADTQFFLHYTASLLKYTHFWKSAFVTHRKGKRIMAVWNMAVSYQIYVTFVKVDMVKKIKTTYWTLNCNFYDKNIGQRFVRLIILYINEKFNKTISTCTLLGKFNLVITLIPHPVSWNELHFLYLFNFLAFLRNLGRGGVTSRCSDGSVSVNIPDKSTGSYTLNCLKMI